MRPLTEFDFFHRYPLEMSIGGYLTNHVRPLDILLGRMKNEENPLRFRNQLFAALELYSDGIFSNGSGMESISSKERVLDQLIVAGESFVDDFYRGEDVDFEEILDIIKPHEAEILKWGSKDYGKIREFGSKDDILELQFFGLNIPMILEITRPDAIVCIASGGFEPSLIVKNIADLEKITSVRYSRRWESGQEIKVLSEIPGDYLRDGIKDKRTLVVDDIMSTGRTIYNVLEFLSDVGPEALYATVPKFIPFGNFVLSEEFSSRFKCVNSIPFVLEYKDSESS